MALLSVGQSALMAAYAQLQTTGHNIANANTPGYSRQEVVLQSAGGLYSGGGFMGMGVDIATVQRRYDRFLGNELMATTANAAADRTRAEQLSRLDDLLADTDSGIGVAIDDLYAAMADVTNNPSSASARQIVLQRAEALAQRIRGVDQQLRQLGREVDTRLAQSASSVNGLLDRVAKLNERIAQTAGSGQPPNDLLDERDSLVVELNQYLKTTTYPQADGTLSVFTAGGEGLVIGSRASRLEAQADPLDGKQQLVMVQGGTRLPMSADSLGGGMLAGLMRFRDNDLTAIGARLGQLAAGIAEAFNRQQALGIDSSGAAGQPMFGLGVPQTIAGAGNTGGASLQATIVDGTQLQAADYQVRYDAGQYVVTTIPAGSSQSFASLPQVIGGVRIELAGSNTPANGDVFMVRAAGAVAGGFTQALSSGARLATGLAMTAQSAAGNGGDLAARDFAVTATGANLTQPVSLTFTSAGTFDVSGTGTGNQTGLTYTPGMTISYNGWSFTLNGTPKPGDRIDIVPTADPATDNRNAKAMIALADQPLAGGETFNDAFAAMLAEVGASTQAAKAAESVSSMLRNNAEAAHTGYSGVNLDEEAARLLQYQQMYQAAAKVIQTAQSMFDTLLQVAGAR